MTIVAIVLTTLLVGLVGLRWYLDPIMTAKRYMARYREFIYTNRRTLSVDEIYTTANVHISVSMGESRVDFRLPNDFTQLTETTQGIVIAIIINELTKPLDSV